MRDPKYGGISADRGVFGRIKGGDEWNNASIEARIDAIIAHEESEFGDGVTGRVADPTAAHDVTVLLGPYTDLPISPEARRLLETMPKKIKQGLAPLSAPYFQPLDPVSAVRAARPAHIA